MWRSMGDHLSLPAHCCGLIGKSSTLSSPWARCYMYVHGPPYLHTSCSLKYILHSAVFFQPRVIGPHAHWEAYGHGSLPLHQPVSDSAYPHYVFQCYHNPSWDHHRAGQL